jgi:hypothetical protein
MNFANFDFSFVAAMVPTVTEETKPVAKKRAKKPAKKAKAEGVVKAMEPTEKKVAWSWLYGYIEAKAEKYMEYEDTGPGQATLKAAWVAGKRVLETKYALEAEREGSLNAIAEIVTETLKKRPDTNPDQIGKMTEIWMAHLQGKPTESKPEVERKPDDGRPPKFTGEKAAALIRRADNPADQTDWICGVVSKDERYTESEREDMRMEIRVILISCLVGHGHRLEDAELSADAATQRLVPQPKPVRHSMKQPRVNVPSVVETDKPRKSEALPKSATVMKTADELRKEALTAAQIAKAERIKRQAEQQAKRESAGYGETKKVSTPKKDGEGKKKGKKSKKAERAAHAQEAA